MDADIETVYPSAIATTSKRRSILCGRPLGTRMIADFFFEVIVEGLFWSTGAGLKKLTGRPLSESGYSEKWLGFLFYAALIVAAIIFISS